MSLRKALALSPLILLLLASPAGAGNQTYKLTALDGAANDKFGFAVSVSGTTAIVGARSDLGETGSAYLFDTRTGLQTAKLVASDGVALDRFGVSVAISGTTAVVGADAFSGGTSGAAYVFNSITGAQVVKLVPNDGASDDYFGYSVAVSGTLAIVGAYGHDDLGPRSGAAYLFDTTTGIQLAKLVALDGATDDFFGYDVGISGTTAIVGAFGNDDNGPLTGAAYLFDTVTATQTAKLLPPGGVQNEFGVSVAIDGTRAIVGAWYDAANGFRAGAAYLYTTAPLTPTGKIFPLDSEALDLFGFGVAISGTIATIGAHGNDDLGVDSGSAYLFDVTTGEQIEKLLPDDGTGGDLFGARVAISGPTTVIGAHLHTGNEPASGAVYAFCAESATYCDGGVSASGCQAALSSNGAASASAATGFSLLASGVEGAKDGLFFFGTNGRQSNAWGNGSSLQCVVPPVKRAGLLVGTGTIGACDGVFAQDLNARWTAKPSQNPGAGAVVQAQLWYRDPFNTSNQTTSLSDAIEFCVEP